MVGLFQQVFKLPENVLINTVFPKSQFRKANKLTADEQKLLREPNLPVKTILRASLQQKSSFIPSLVTDEMDYNDILFFSIQFTNEHFLKFTQQVIKLYQKYIPKPIVLFLWSDSGFLINTAEKNFNEGDQSKRVVKEFYTTPIIPLFGRNELQESFLNEISYANLNKINLFATHQSYCNAIIKYLVAEQTGTYQYNLNKQSFAQLQQLQTLKKEINALRNSILKSKHLAEKIELKTELVKKKRQCFNIEQEFKKPYEH